MQIAVRRVGSQARPAVPSLVWSLAAAIVILLAIAGIFLALSIVAVLLSGGPITPPLAAPPGLDV